MKHESVGIEFLLIYIPLIKRRISKNRKHS